MTSLFNAWLVFVVMVTSANVGVSRDVAEPVKLGVILPFSAEYPWSIRRTGEAIAYAVHSVQRRSDLLPSYQVTIKVTDSHCSETLAPLAAMDMYWKREAHVFVGPACDYAVAPVARFAPYWNIPVITGGAMVRAFNTKSLYPLLTRISGSHAKMGEMVARTLAHFGWVNVSFMYHGNMGPNQYKGKTDAFFLTEGIYHAHLPAFQQKNRHKEPTTKQFDEHFDFAAQIGVILQELPQYSRSRLCR